MQIVNSAIYLGYQLGPTSGSMQWLCALAKFKGRVNDIHSRARGSAHSIREYNSRAIPTLGYLGQLSLPPSRMLQRELAAVTKVLHMATNSLSYNAAFELHNMVGLKICNIRETLKATMLRTAHKTLENIKPLYRNLLSAAREYLPASAIVLNKINVPGWDSSPFIVNLFEALEFSCFDNGLKLDLIQAKNNERRRGLASLQASFSRALAEHRPSGWGSLLQRRLSVLIPGSGILVDQALKSLVTALSTTTQSNGLLVIKTVANSWTTSYRYHEHVLLDCVFGCHKMRPLRKGATHRDTLSHYLVCPRLWSMINHIWPYDSPADAESRLCLTPSAQPPAFGHRPCHLSRTETGYASFAQAFQNASRSSQHPHLR